MRGDEPCRAGLKRAGLNNEQLNNEQLTPLSTIHEH
jgi:hypothetical protein